MVQTTYVNMKRGRITDSQKKGRFPPAVARRWTSYASFPNSQPLLFFPHAARVERGRRGQGSWRAGGRRGRGLARERSGASGRPPPVGSPGWRRAEAEDGRCAPSAKPPATRRLPDSPMLHLPDFAHVPTRRPGLELPVPGARPWPQTVARHLAAPNRGTTVDRSTTFVGSSWTSLDLPPAG
jgi:hypothetical protein